MDAFFESTKTLTKELRKIRDGYEDQGEDVVYHYSLRYIQSWFNNRGDIPI